MQASFQLLQHMEGLPKRLVADGCLQLPRPITLTRQRAQRCRQHCYSTSSEVIPCCTITEVISECSTLRFVLVPQVPGRKPKLVGMGGCGLDMLAQVAAFPEPDTKTRTEQMEVGDSILSKASVRSTMAYTPVLHSKCAFCRLHTTRVSLP